MSALGFKPTAQPTPRAEEVKQEPKSGKEKPKGFLKSAFNFMTGGMLGGEAPKPKEEIQKPPVKVETITNEPAEKQAPVIEIKAESYTQP